MKAANKHAHSRDVWRSDAGGTVRVGVKVARPWLAFLTLVAAIGVLFVAVSILKAGQQPTTGEWIVCWLCFFMSVAGLYGACWHAFGRCELVLAPDLIILHQGVGPLVTTRRMAAADLRKVERVEQISADNGRRLQTTFYIFGSGRPWRFGDWLTLAAAHHLWADLSRGRKSSTRIEKVVPSAD